MTSEEFSNQYDVLFNNITSNQAPGLDEYEKSVFLTKAQDEILKNYFTTTSKGNSVGQGFDDSAKRQIDFSSLMATATGSPNSTVTTKIDSRSKVFTFPSGVFIIINEVASVGSKNYQVVPLRYDEYTRLMSKPYQRPLKNQVWRLLNKGVGNGNAAIQYAELIAHPNEELTSYTVRYIRRPKPIIVGDLGGLTIIGYSYGEEPAPTPSMTTSLVDRSTGDTEASISSGESINENTGTSLEASSLLYTKGCELDPILHEDILQRAVELAKIAWTSTGQDNAQLVLQAGQRSE